MNLTQATKLYLQAKAQLEIAEKAKKTAEVAMKQAFAEAGIDYNVVDGMKVTVTRKGRRTLNAETLAQMVGKTLYNKVVKPAVDTKKFDAAVAVGIIKPEVADAVTKVTEYDEVRVTDLADNAEGNATVKVA